MGQIEGFVRLGLAPSICPECRQEVIGRATGVEKLLRWEKALQSSSVQLVCFVLFRHSPQELVLGLDWSEDVLGEVLPLISTLGPLLKYCG